MNATSLKAKPKEWCVDDSFWQDIDALIFPPSRISLAKEEVAHLLRLPPPFASHPLTVLDVGCGVGRHCIEFAQLGHRVIGVDHSAFLLQKAKENSAAKGVKVDFQRQDMREMEFNANCDLVVSLYSSFGYFTQPEDDLRVLQNIYRSLKPGGKFVLDIGSKETIARNFSPLQYFGDTDTGSFLHRIVIGGWEQLDLKWFINKHGQIKRYHTRVRIYSGSELSTMLKNSGFSRVHLFGDFTGCAFDSEAKRLVMVGEKS